MFEWLIMTAFYAKMYWEKNIIEIEISRNFLSAQIIYNKICSVKFGKLCLMFVSL